MSYTQTENLMSIKHDGTDYPPPPWNLHTTMAVAGSLIDVREARKHIPDDFEIVEIRPGRTLGAVGLVDYGPGSIFPYNELVVICGLVRIAGRTGGWISHIYVDSTRSQAGGIELFGLPKQLASFTRIVKDGKVHLDIESDRGSLMTSITPNVGWGIPVRLGGTAFGSVDGDRRLLEFKSVGRVLPVSVQLTIPAQSPFAHLGLAKPMVSLAGKLKIAAGSRIQILHTGSLPKV
jgi:acetoacetate decarboxylase